MVEQIVIASNRLPVEATSADHYRVAPGGLVAAVWPVAKRLGATWVGWGGSTLKTELPNELEGIKLSGVELSAAEVEAYYEGFANSFLWPLAHDRVDLAHFEQSWWQAYRSVNKKFAAKIASELSGAGLGGAALGSRALGGTVWVHDYHLYLVPQYLKQLLPDVRVGFFLHTPAPNLSSAGDRALATEILTGLAHADLIGVQSERDLQALQAEMRSAGLPPPLADAFELGVFAVSIDVQQQAMLVASSQPSAPPDVWRQGSLKFLSVDRLDYTKGILERLAAFELFLTQQQQTRARRPPQLLQVLVPTRQSVAHYQTFSAQVRQLTAKINSRFGRFGYEPVINVYANQTQEQLAQLYGSADVLVVSALKDGMNLVAKEFVASRLDETGTLLLSEQAGSAEELRDAVLFDPNDLQGFVRALQLAARMSEAEQRVRMRAMQSWVRGHDNAAWAAAFLGRLARHS